MDKGDKGDEESSQTAECDTDFFGPSLPPHYFKNREEEKIYGPSLPLTLSKKDEVHSGVIPPSASEEKDKILIGPDLPEYLKSAAPATEVEEEEGTDDDDDDDVNDFGPSTTLMASGDVGGSYTYMNTPIQNKKNTNEASIEREAWMTELPEKKIASLGLLPRHFKTRLQTDKESDSSVWTDTPADKKRKEKNNRKDLKEVLKKKRMQERDKEMEKLAKKMAKKLRKKESLLEIHQKNLKRKEKEKRGKEKGAEALPERRPFDRNVDLQIRKFDENQRRSILDKSQFLNNRFASGESKFL